MPQSVGKITNIKVGSFLQESVNAFDIGTVTLHETATNADGTANTMLLSAARL